ncbi:COG1361 family protein [Nonomuraea recticatena]|uniref:TRAM domain-containing protein n=1 Tax=Nonomuraea recticatena TaxID=46178 RepID=A0ABN3R2Q0_9ACTN
MRFNTSLAVAGALSLAVLTAGPVLAEPVAESGAAPTAVATTPAPAATKAPEPTKAPAAKAPETKVPETKAPETKAPEAKQTQAPAAKKSAQPVKKVTKVAKEQAAEPAITGVTLSSATVTAGQAYEVTVTTSAVADGKRVHVQGFGDPKVALTKDGKAVVPLVAPSDATPGAKTLKISVEGVATHSSATVTVVEAAKPAIVDAVVSPGLVAPGENYTVAVSTKDVADGKRVHVQGLGGPKVAYVKDGRATVALTAPADAAPGVSTLTISVEGVETRLKRTIEVGQAIPSSASVTVTPGTVHPGDKVGVRVRSSEPRATDARVTSPAFSGKHAFTLAKGQGEITAATWNDLKPGQYPVTVEIILGERVIATAQTTLTVTAKPVTPTPIVSVDLQLTPGKVRVGGSYLAGVHTDNVKPGTAVVITTPDGKKHTVEVDDFGDAVTRLHVPKDAKPGAYEVVATLPGGQSSTASLTVTQDVVPGADLYLKLSPGTVYAGGDFTAFVASDSAKPGTEVVIADPGGKAVTTKINAHGVAAVRFHVSSGTKAGAYVFSADMERAKKVYATLTVKKRVVAQTDGLTPRGGAETGGGIVAAQVGAGTGGGFGGVALGGLLMAAGVGAAFLGRRRRDQV